MSEIVFLNNESDPEVAMAQRQPETPERNRVDEPFDKSEMVHSKDFTDIKPFCASRYGNSRLFTAHYNGRKVVIKTLKRDRATNNKCRASLRQEYDMTAALDNKFIRKALDFVSIQGLGDCIVFEFIEGKSLAEHVRVGTLSEKQVKTILVDVCDGLTYLHRNQMVHCNLKPENIIVTANDSRAKLIDLGIPETDPDADRELLIKEMAFVAPEIIKGEEADSRADIYSLGKIMEFFAERNITRQYQSVGTHCTQFSKEQRYDTISEVRSAITKGHPVVKTIVLVLVLCLIGGLAFVYVPKIKANVERERAERRIVEFNREVEKIQAELPQLCEKYALKSLSEPIAVDWSEDSVRYAQILAQYMGHDESLPGLEDFHSKAMRVYKEQRIGIENSRKADFDRLLLKEFKAANDSVAVVLKTPLVDPTDEQMLVEAQKWFGQMK